MRAILIVGTALLVACSSGPSAGDYVFDLGAGAPAGAPPSGSGSGAAAKGPGDGGLAKSPSPGAASNNPGASVGTFDAAVDRSSVTLDLMASDVVHVTLTPRGGFSGSVAISVAGLPNLVTATLDRETVDLSSGPQVITVTVASQSAALPGSSSPHVVATAGTTTATAPLSLTINPRITVMVTGSAFTPSPLALSLGKEPTHVVMHNADAAPHTVHADNAQQGFAHGNEITPGADEGNTQAGVPRTVNAKMTYDYYLHENPAIKGRIIVQ